MKINDNDNTPNAFKLEMLEPRLLLSADPVLETVHTISQYLSESVINVCETTDSCQNNSFILENQNSTEQVALDKKADIENESDDNDYIYLVKTISP